MRKQVEKIKELQHEKGFTLIELMAVLAILAVIVAIAVPAIGTVMAKSQASAEKSSIELMERAGELAHLDGLGFDDVANERYAIPTLVSEGYLKLETDSPFHDDVNYVEKLRNGTFLYNWTNPGIEHLNKQLVFGDTPSGDLQGDAVTVSPHTYDWTVPFTGKYLVEVWSGQGGNAGFGKVGEFRTYVVGSVEMTQGMTLHMVLGQRGENGFVANDYDSNQKSGSPGSGGGSTGVLLNDDLLVQSKGGSGGDGRANVYGNSPSFGGKTGGFGYVTGGATTSTYPNNLVGGIGGGENAIDSGLFQTVTDFSKVGTGNGMVRITLIDAK